ncbi:MAG: FHA domain-containing protein [Propionibacteriaceae bacterium]
MTWDAARWSPGSAWTFVWPGGTLMLSVDLEGERLDLTVDRIWGSLSDDVTLSGVLQLLTDALGASLLSLPDFAVALFDGPAGQFAARGHFEVKVGQAAGAVTVAGLGVTTWSERAVDGILSVSLGEVDTAEGGRGLPVRAGVVQASRVSWGALAPLSLDAQQPVGAAVLSTRPVDAAPPRGPAPAPTLPPAAAEPVAATPEPMPAPVDGSAALDEGVPTMTSAGVATEPSGATTVVEPTDEPNVADPAEPTDVPEDAPVPAAASRFAALWGDTAAYSIEEAAVRIEDEESAKASHSSPRSAGEGTAASQASGDHVELISSVPGRGGSAAAPTAPVTEDWSDHDGATVVGFSLGSAAAEPEPEPAVSEMVLALLCPSGHSNRPHRETCRDCGALLSAGFTQTVRRPALGQIRSSTGEIVPLTGPVLIGRSPRAARFQGTVSPRLLSLPYQHVSSTHLEVRLEGWNVFAVDLNSMNGAYLRRHDEPPVRVTHTPLMLADGDVIDFGHGVSIAFEGMP